jgi:hypothetical protein
MIKIIICEFRKYISPLVIALLLFYILYITIFAGFTLRKWDDELIFIKNFNYYFSTFILFTIPLTVFIYVGAEFKSGYAGKLISNGLSRKNYIVRKFIFFVTLSIICTIIYFIAFFSLYSFGSFNLGYLIVESGISVFFISLLTICIAACLTITIKNAIVAFFIYYVYYTLEKLLFELKHVNFPLSYFVSLFQFKSVVTTSSFAIFVLLDIILVLLLTVFTYYRFKQSAL